MSHKAKIWYGWQCFFILLFMTASGVAWAAPDQFITSRSWQVWLTLHVIAVVVGSALSVHFADTPSDIGKPVGKLAAFCSSVFVGGLALALHNEVATLSGFTLFSVGCVSATGSSGYVIIRKIGLKYTKDLGGLK